MACADVLPLVHCTLCKYKTVNKASFPTKRTGDLYCCYLLWEHRQCILPVQVLEKYGSVLLEPLRRPCHWAAGHCRDNPVLSVTSPNS